MSITITAHLKSADLIIVRDESVESPTATVVPESENIDVEIEGETVRIEERPAGRSTRGSVVARLSSLVVVTDADDSQSTVTVTVPASARLAAETGAGDITAEALEHAEIRVGSGDVVLGGLGEGIVMAGSGDITVRSLSAEHGSGDVCLQAGSGDVAVRRVEGTQTGRTLRVKTGSGDAEISIAHGTAAFLDCLTGSGTVENALESIDEPGAGLRTVRIKGMTGSGDLLIRRA